MRVFILTTCRNRSALYGNVLTAATIRTGFPTARVTVYDNGSPSDLSAEIEAAYVAANCEFRAITERLHGEWMEERLYAADPDEPLVFVDPDVIFWKSFEDHGAYGYALFGGRYFPRIFENGAVQEARLHPSLLIIPHPGTLIENIKRIQETTPYFRPFAPFTYFRDGEKVIVDTAASLYGALGDACYAFGEEELDRYDHIFGGTTALVDASLVLTPATISALQGPHAAVKRGDLESLRGLWRKQEQALAVLASKVGHMTTEAGHGPMVSWNYLSGRVRSDDGRAWGFSVARFTPEGMPSATHWTISDLKTGEYLYGEICGRALSGISASLPDNSSLSILLPPTTRAVEHKSVRYGVPTKYLSAPSMGCAGYVEKGGERTVLHGDCWRDHEEMPQALVRGWDWLSLRLDDGRRIMLYGPHGGEPFGTVVSPDGAVTHLAKADFSVETIDSYLSEDSLHVYPCRWRVRVAGVFYTVEPYIRNQEIAAKDVTYWEGICKVTQNGLEVGYAFAELTGYRELTEAEMGFRWAKSDKDAVAMMEIFGSGSHLADDLVDERLTVGAASEKTVEMLSLAMGLLPNNAFYKAHRTQIEPLVMSGLTMWGASNIFAMSDHLETRMHGFVYRNIMVQLIVMVALIVGGTAWARKVAQECVIYFHGKKNGQRFAEWELEQRRPQKIAEVARA